MARDDDDGVSDRPLPKARRDRENEDEADDDRPRKKSARDDDDDDDDRPRKKKRSRDDDDDYDDERRGVKKKKKKNMPGLLIAAAIVSMVWGGLNVLGNCGASLHSLQTWNNFRRAEQMFPGMIRLAEGFGGVGQGYFITMAIVYFCLLAASAVLAIGGILLIMQKTSGKWVAIGGVIAMAGVAVLGAGASLIVSRFGTFDGLFVGMPVSIFFTLCVGGFLLFALMDKDTNRALQ